MGRHVVFVRVVCLSIRLSVCLSVCPSHFLVRTITPICLMPVGWNFIYGKSIMRGSVMHKGHNSGFNNIGVIALCTFFSHFLVRTITPIWLMPLDWNFIHGKSMMSGSVMYKGHNSGFNNIGVIALCTFFSHFLVRTITPIWLMPLDWNFIHGKSMMSGSVMYKGHNSGFNTFGVVALCYIFLSYQ